MGALPAGWYRSFVIAAVVVGALIIASSTASADTNTSKAKQLYDEGVTSYNLGHYDEALNAFEMAYRLRHDPAFLFNIGQCQRAVKRYDEAKRSYRAYVRETPSVPDETRAQVQQLIDDMERTVANDLVMERHGVAPRSLCRRLSSECGLRCTGARRAGSERAAAAASYRMHWMSGFASSAG